MQKLWKDFIKCGILGWCLEITFTALHSLQQRKFTLQGTTSLWMFPIYGAGCLLRPICALVKKCHWFVRGCVYALFIFVAEYLSGRFLLKKGLCPWSYGKARWNIGKVIRLDCSWNRQSSPPPGKRSIKSGKYQHSLPHYPRK